MIAAVVAAYANSFRGTWVFDDLISILRNPTIAHLWPLGAALRPPGGGLTVTGRPLLNLSFALNRAISGGDPWSYHLFNLAIHLTAALALLGILRRTLPAADVSLATVMVVLWAVHPLNTEAVTYVVQRAESMMGMFYLLTLYGFLRRWRTFSVVMCLLGMATKEVMGSAPLAVLALDALFVSGSVRSALRRAPYYYAALAATWLLLAWEVVGGASRGGTAGFGSGVSFGQYWLTQFPAILHYLRLAFLPYPLVFDYGVQWVASGWSVVPAAIAVFLLMGLTAAGWRKGAWRRLALLGTFFFAILAPTSLVPGNRQTLAEHRMYLALIPVVVLAVLALGRLVLSLSRTEPLAARELDPREVAPDREAGPAKDAEAASPSSGGKPDALRRTPRRLRALKGVLFVVALGLAVATAKRNEIYRSNVALWTQTIARRPGNAFAHYNLGEEWLQQRRLPEAEAQFRAALELKPDYAEGWNNLAGTLVLQGDKFGARDAFARAAALKPREPDIRNNLAGARLATGDILGAIADYEQAVAVDPDFTDARDNLAHAFVVEGRLPEAEAQFVAVLQRKPDDGLAQFNLANLYAREGRYAEADPHFIAAARLAPKDAHVPFNRGNALLMSGHPAEAAAQYREALRLDPGFTRAQDMLRHALAR